jgi:hypothetical protein
MDAAIKNPKSTAYDSLIQTELTAYQARFDNWPSFPALDWKLFKALLFVESGGPSNPAWTARAMQIGNPGDPAYAVLVNGGEGSSAIMSVQLKADIATKPITMPEVNIKAAIAYILTKSAEFGSQQVIDDPTLRKHKVISGENPISISRKEHTTVGNIALNNPTAVKKIYAGQSLAFQRAHMIPVWAPITPDFLASAYNGGRDPEYANKLRYVYGKL